MSLLSRYRHIADLITPFITAESLKRLDATLMDLRAKAMASSKNDKELLSRFNQAHIDKVNDLMATENAWRIRQWAEKILNEENAVKEICTAQTQELAPVGERQTPP